ncbi:hypothetical protein BD309DRAFT_946347 [Dichomitus squalens]|uniref:Uncharacterized protein n=1 Tax=Dichomitus squalens TaxID=114155 RepID=A0A4Q9P8D6_9APHY|nr:hypothetical protein BD311DRAFT_746230 [Dichomitus squalens]TBU50075.1 hypothetical protein BD309DRAFT_946347 [Dichomitus squalens]
MNCPANTTVATRHIFALAAHCSQDWKITKCPLALMFDLIEAGARLVLIGIASAVLAIAGFLLSVLAHVKEVTSGRSLRNISPDDAPATAESTSPSRERDSGVPSPRTSRAHRTPSKPSSSGPRHRDLSRGRHASRRDQSPTTLRSSSSAKEAPGSKKESEQRVTSRKSRLRRPICQTLPDAAPVASPVRTSPDTTRIVEITTTLPPLRPTRAFSDISSNQSSELSAESPVPEEHSPLPGRQVLQKLKERHSYLRERCLVRAQSMPVPRTRTTSRPARRTDPYQAPYFFPTPMSPEAGTYLQEVVKERHGEYPQPVEPVTESSTIDPNAALALSPSSPTREESAKPPQPTPPPSPPARSTAREPAAEAEHRQRRQRWSWHMPHLPSHHQSNERGRSVEGARQDKEILSKLKFGHHRRRHGTGSDDVRTASSPKAS